MKIAALGMDLLVERMMSFLLVGDSAFARASPGIFLPEDGKECCLADFGGCGTISVLRHTLLAAKLCFAIWPLRVLQGCPAKLHVAVCILCYIVHTRNAEHPWATVR